MLGWWRYVFWKLSSWGGARERRRVPFIYSQRGPGMSIWRSPLSRSVKGPCPIQLIIPLSRSVKSPCPIQSIVPLSRSVKGRPLPYSINNTSDSLSQRPLSYTINNIWPSTPGHNTIIFWIELFFLFFVKAYSIIQCIVDISSIFNSKVAELWMPEYLIWNPHFLSPK